MAREIKKAKPKLQHLLVLKTYIEHGYDLLHGSPGSMSRSNPVFTKLTEDATSGKHLSPEEGVHPFDWWRNNKADKVFHNLYQWGWIVRVSKTKFDGDLKSHIAWYQHPYKFTKLAREYWAAEGEALYEKLVQEAADKLAEVDRLVMITTKNGRTRRKAGMLVRVVRETAKRLYIEEVARHTQVGEAVELLYFSEWEYLEGNGNNKYVSRDQVTFDGVTQEEFERRVRLENRIETERKAIVDDAEAEIAEIRRRRDERIEQKKAEWILLEQTS